MKLRKEQIAGGNYQYTRHPFSHFVESMKRMDVHHIELYAASPHLYVDDYTPGTVGGQQKLLREAGIAVCCLTAEQCLYPVSAAIDDPIVRERSLRYYEKALELAAAFESPYMQMISGSGLIGSDPGEDWKRSADGIARLMKTAERVGVTIVLEADRTCTVKDTPDQLKMIKEIGSDHLSGMIDTNAIYHAGEDFEESVKLLGPHLRHLHFIDLKPDGGCLVPGSGILPMKEYLDVLGKYGYEGYLTPELWGFRYQECADEAMQQSLDFCRGCLDD
ncbi:sugar phosphate isomerase/epimerase family protein [Harryflintia acetispora]|uniref:Protein FrlC n=1 Tax=Harryflintia acetispora TaxID=1849041 RepID=A0A9X8Y8F7_9FIRM|nr:sugar phosphate isomerase/epimerase [Harryflintia acetispora]TCL43770.1 protein FrlC [Harryflintia acetispora]